MKPVRFFIAGAGSRGISYASFAERHPDRAQVVGVAEPRDHYRQAMSERHSVPAERQFSDWKQAATQEPFADAVIIATQDTMHLEPALAFAEKGYAILLEKPMAPNEPDCVRIVEAAIRHKIPFSVCHVLRYTDYTREIKGIIDSGAIGEIVSIQHFEPVGYWHQAHSYVRGNWRNEETSSCMLLAKSCHDIDWIHYMMGKRCHSVSSYGGLHHFRGENKPIGSADRCTVCPVEKTCPYSALKIYLGRLERGEKHWPLDVLTPNMDRENVMKALEEGPYGRCVYACDNTVVDHQVVNLEFAGGNTASMTMTGFCRARARETRIFGTRGEVVGDGSFVHVFDFLTDQTRTIDTRASDSTIAGGHGGGDYGIMNAFTRALEEGDLTHILSGPEETLESHLLVFAAERSRRENRRIDLA